MDASAGLANRGAGPLLPRAVWCACVVIGARGRGGAWVGWMGAVRESAGGGKGVRDWERWGVGRSAVGGMDGGSCVGGDCGDVLLLPC